MKDHDNQFYPESVEIEIDKILQIQAQAEITEQKQVPLLRALHEQYMDDPEVLDRAWKRVTQQIKSTEQQIVLEMPIPIQDYQIAKGNPHMQDQVISRNYNKGKNRLKRLSGIGSGLVAALLIASAIMIFLYHQQSLSSHPSQTASQQHQTQSTTNQTPVPGTKVPGPASSEITIQQMATAIQYTNPNGQKAIFTPTENYIFHTGQRISVAYTAQSWQKTNGNNTLKWYQNDTLYVQQNPESISPSIESHKGPSSMYTKSIVYKNPGLDKVEIYWGNQLAWTIYFTVK